MKQKILALLVIVIYLSSCRKDSVKPQTAQTPVNQQGQTSTTITNQTNLPDDSTKGYLGIQLADYSTNTDNILLVVKPDAKMAYVKNEDAPTLQGFGMVTLSSLSSDNVALAINVVPLSNKGLSVNLKVNAKIDGTYHLNLPSISSIPTKLHVWLMDDYKKDSLDFRHYQTYAFDLLLADTNSYGSHRFRVVIRE